MKKIQIIFITLSVFTTSLFVNSDDVLANNTTNQVVSSPNISSVFNMINLLPLITNQSALPNSFTLNLLTSPNNSDNDSNPDVSIEFAPYWLSPKPNLTFDEYNSKSGFCNSFWQTLTISIAEQNTTMNHNGIELEGSRIGIGLKASLLSGIASDSTENAKQVKVSALTKITARQNTLRSQFYDAKENKWNDLAAQNEDKSLESAATELAQDIAKLNGSKVGWQLNTSLQSTLDFPRNNRNNYEFNDAQLVMALSYIPDIPESSHAARSALSQFKFSGVGKYTYKEEDHKDIFDVGANLTWNSITYPISFSVEYLHRFNEDSDDDKLVGLIEYLIGKERKYSIFASYGKTFDDDFKGSYMLLSGIAIGLGETMHNLK